MRRRAAGIKMRLGAAAGRYGSQRRAAELLAQVGHAGFDLLTFLR
jgi:hypothetical protein